MIRCDTKSEAREVKYCLELIKGLIEMGHFDEDKLNHILSYRLDVEKLKTNIKNIRYASPENLLNS